MIKILIGPLYNNLAILGDYEGHPDIKTFTSLPCELPDERFDITYQHPVHFLEILESLPLGWQPDVVIWWDLIYRAIPPGIADCPYPTAVFVGDWNLGFLNTLSYISAFDFVFGDRPLIQQLKSLGYENCAYWPAYSFDPNRHYRMPQEEQIFDMTFIGNLDQLVQRQRGHYLERLARRADRYRIFIGGGIFGGAYTRLMNQSKIVFNHSIRGEMNMRAYEAPACGALLFMEESNQEVRDYLEAGQECVLYNDRNLEELLDYYLTHEEERKTLARAGHERIQSFSYTHHFERLLERVPQIQACFQGPQNRSFHQRSLVEQHLIVAGQLYHATTENARRSALDHLNQSGLFDPEHLEQTDPQILSMMAIFLLDSQLKYAQDTEPDLRKQAQQGFQFAHTLFNMLKQREPTNPIHHYHAGFAALQLRQTQQALDNYQQALVLLKQPALTLPLTVQRQVLPLGYQYRLSIEWERCGFEHAHDRHALSRAYCSLFRWQIAQQMAHIYQQENQLSEAVVAYQTAINERPDLGESWFLLGQVLLETGDRAGAIQAWEQVLNIQPFMTEAWLALCEQYIYTSRFQDAKRLATESLTILNIHNPTFDQERQQLQYWQKVAQIACGQIDTVFDPDFYHFLQHLDLADNHRLKPLRDLTQVVWDPLEPEALPVLQSEWGFSRERGDYKVTVCYHAPDIKHAHYQRTQRLTSDLKKGYVGLDCIPYLFPAVKPSKRLELEGWKQFNCLLLANTVDSPAIVDGLKTFIESRIPQMACIVWCPLRVPQEEEIERVAAQLDTDSDASMILLSEPLAVDEQVALLRDVDMVMGDPENMLDFYLWWSLFQGTPIAYRDKSLKSCYPGISEQELRHYQIPDWKTLFDRCHDLQQVELTQRIREKLTDYHEVETPKQLMNTLWEIKCRQVNL